MAHISDTLRDDHRELEACYEKIVGLIDPDEKALWQNQFAWELARHLHAEELLIYPALEHRLHDGKVLVHEDRERHQNIKEKLKKFQDIKSSSSSFVPALHDLMKNLEPHFKETEKHALPDLEQALSSRESVSMSNSFAQTKFLVPSRSHPMNPNKPPFATPIALLTAPLDRIADLCRHFPQATASPKLWATR